VVTMADVAEVADVAASTVSHVLNGTRHVSDQTRKRVQDAISSTGYRHNALARSLVTQRTYTIGLSISVLTNPYFASLVHAMEQVASKAGYTLVLGDSHDEIDIERRVVSSLLDRRVDGLIIAPSPGAEQSVIPMVRNNSTPFVLIDRLLPTDCDQVAPTNIQPVEMLTSHLLDLGHLRIAAVTGLPGLPSSIERQEGYEKALLARGITPDPQLIACGQSNVEDAYLQTLELLRRSDPPTALVVLNNAMTIGAMKALRQLGRSIPRDMALVCYDDFEWADLFEPRLTAMAQDVVAMGRTAVEMLLERIEGSDKPRRQIQIDPTYRHRASCGCHEQTD
jgi:LacI family transcriptional regulator